MPKPSSQSRAYFTLAIREDDGVWRPQFGAYDRATVENEARESWPHIKLANRAIVKSDPHNDAIDEAIARLNRASARRDALVAQFDRR